MNPTENPSPASHGMSCVALPLFSLTVTIMASSLASQLARAGVVTWDVDPTNSYIRLTIPDQAINVPDIGNVTIRMRDATSTTQWTDAGGRRASLDGQIVTDYADGRSITFLGGLHDLYALETTSLRPNPARWDASVTNYTDTSTAPAALGGRVRGTYILTFDAAFVAFRAVQLDLTNATGSALAITNWTFGGNLTRCGITSALVDVDGIPLPLGLGQPIPDVLHGALSPVVEENAAGGTITDLGGRNRKLTYTIHIPDLAMDLNGTLVTGSAEGSVVAYAVLPEPPPPPLLSAQRLGAHLVFAWPTNATGFALEYTTILPATNWIPAAPPAGIVDGQNVVTNTMMSGAAFYRLRKP